MKNPKETSLANTGLRTTLPRLLILEVLKKSEVRHLGAEEIYDALRESKEEVGLATVYRVLTQFEQNGLVLKHRFGEDSKAYYELNDERHHDHMVCVECGDVYEFVDEKIEKRQETVAGSLGFVLQDHSLLLYGVCSGMEKDGECSMKKDQADSIYQFGSESAATS